MKNLKKILLINWLYYTKQLMEVGDINFLTGKTGAEKSTIIDALQIALLGELNTRNFNKAASDNSQRTLDSYLRADMDPNNPHSRKGRDFSSYIACEFLDDQTEERFVIGIVFDCRSDGSRQERFFTYDGVIPGDCFIVNGQAMDISSLRTRLRALPGAHAILYDSNQQYRKDVLAKWNVHNEQLCRMMKKAVSFKPISNIQDFITENICDAQERPDAEAMQQNIRDYKRHEELAKRQEDKLAALTNISALFREMQNAIDNLQQHRFLSLWADKAVLGAKILKSEKEREDRKTEMAANEAEEQRLSELYAQKDARKNELIATKAKSDVYQEQSRLLTKQQQLTLERGRLTKNLDNTALEIRRESQSLCAMSAQLAALPEDSEFAALKADAQALAQRCGPLRECTSKVFAGSLTVFEAVQATVSSFSEHLRDAAYLVETHLAELRRSYDENEATLADLRRNIKDYPKGLLDLRQRLENELSTDARSASHVTILADVLEIKKGSEAWRGAVEGYLNTQKFYLLVEPSDYTKALAIYDQVKAEYGRQSYGLVDLKKLREKERLDAQPNSLASKIETRYPLARDYIDFLLGHVICCDDVQLLREHRTAITAAGMVYQGYVARPLPRDRMEDSFIGRDAVRLRMERLQEQQAVLKSDIDCRIPLEKQLRSYKAHEPVFSRRFLAVELTQCQNDYLRGLELIKELNELDQRLAGLNLIWLSELENNIKALEAELQALTGKEKACSETKGRLEAQLHDLEYEKLPALYQAQSEKENLIAESFTEAYRTQVGMPRYTQELARLKQPSVIAKNFGDHLQQTQNEEQNARAKLFAARADYVRDFQPCSFRTDVMDNDEFDAERKILEESQLPLYCEKMQKARQSALEQFQNDFLYKLKASIEQAQQQVRDLNRALRQAQFGTDEYEFIAAKNPDYAEYYDMITSKELMDEGGLFALPFQQKYAPLIEALFGRIAASDDTQMNARKQSELKSNIDLYTDYRTYLKFDLATTDRNGNRQLLSQTLNTKSGGETQTPFYIAILASFAQIYQVNNLSTLANNTVRLVVFDEAFNKMDSDRIIESVRLLRKLHLQAIISTPPDKIQDIAPEADRTFLVCKDKYRMFIRPYGKESA